MNKPVSVFDAAQYILEKLGSMTTWKLQKLVYYSQAWSLVWDERPLFRDRIEAWANGPVVPRLYAYHRGNFTISSLAGRGDASRLDDDQVDTLDAVIEAYGDKTSQWLSDLTHREAPWRGARTREGLSVGERGNAVIHHDDIADYFESL